MEGLFQDRQSWQVQGNLPPEKSQTRCGQKSAGESKARPDGWPISRGGLPTGVEMILYPCGKFARVVSEVAEGPGVSVLPPELPRSASGSLSAIRAASAHAGHDQSESPPPPSSSSRFGSSEIAIAVSAGKPRRRASSKSVDQRAPSWDDHSGGGGAIAGSADDDRVRVGETAGSGPPGSSGHKCQTAAAPSDSSGGSSSVIVWLGWNHAVCWQREGERKAGEGSR